MAKLTDEQIEALQVSVHDETVTLENLQEGIYRAWGFSFFDKVQVGFQRRLDKVEFGTPDYDTLVAMKNNVWSFAAAKSYHMVKDMRNFLFEGTGLKVALEPFIARSDFIARIYSGKWFEVEAEMAERQALAAREWVDIQREKELLPFLRYRTVGDARVREEHAGWEGTTLPVNHWWWNTHYPPNGYNCRCEVEQLAEAVVSDLPKNPPKKTFKGSMAETLEEPPTLFRMNAGKDQKIFRDSHPYWRLGAQHVQLKELNYNLGIPEENHMPDGETLGF